MTYTVMSDEEAEKIENWGRQDVISESDFAYLRRLFMDMLTQHAGTGRYLEVSLVVSRAHIQACTDFSYTVRSGPYDDLVSDLIRSVYSDAVITFVEDFT